MSRRSEAVRNARLAKLERRRLATFPQSRNENAPLREQRGVALGDQPGLICRRSRSPARDLDI